MGRPPTHGLSHTPTWNAWSNMRDRCRNPKATRGLYFKKGIKVCKRWEIFENFLLDMGHRPNGKSLERIDRGGDYKPSNCTWATAKEQAVNRDTTHLITARGITKHLTDWARDLNIQPSAIRWRIANGWGEEQAVTYPPRRDSRRGLRTKPIGSW